MNTKTIEEVISDLKAQCDTKASAVADLLEDMRFNVEAKDFTLLDCADEVADMGEWGNYAAEQLRGKKTEVKASPSASELAAKGFENIKINSALVAAKTARLAKTDKPEGLIDIVRGMNDHAAKKEKQRGYAFERLIASAPEMFNILVEVEAASRMRRPIKKATWLKVCAILKQVDGVNR